MSRYSELASVSAVLGRRQTVKYLSLGVLATITAACSRGEEATRPKDGAVAPNSLIGQSISAFLIGKWTMDEPLLLDNTGNSTYPPMTIRVHKQGRWVVEFRGKPKGANTKEGEMKTEGRWEFKNNLLKIWGWDEDPDSATPAHEARAVPEKVANSALIEWLKYDDSFASLNIKWDQVKQLLTIPMMNPEDPADNPSWDVSASLKRLSSNPDS